MSNNETNMNNETFVYMGGDMVVPQDVVRVRVHPSVTVIPEKAFYQRSRLKEIELCEGLQEIGSYAFGMSSAYWDSRSVLKQIRVPSSVRLIGDYAFRHCKQLEEVVLCEGLLEIGSYAFKSCTALKRIDIPSSVENIGSHAFDYCTKLKEVDLSDGLLEIGSHAFDSCEKLEYFKVPSSVSAIGANVFSDCTLLGDVELCEGLLDIGDYAFIRCTSLKRIRIPSTVSVIGMRTFKECTKLDKVELSEGLIEIRDSAFYDCGLKSINFPSTVKTICGWAFAHVPLKNLSLPDNIESIGDRAFWNWNEAFTAARLPPLIATISGFMCRSRGLLSIEVSESIERIDNLAFESCGMLRNLALPSNAEIGFDAFKDCLDLKKLGSERNIINLLKQRFDNLPIHKMLYYQSYGHGRFMRGMFDDPSIKQQDTLGMTPLHILACSTTQNVELYKILIEKHPESLITKDRWGALPILYAVWKDVSSEIMTLLIKSYQSIFPNYEFDWNMMLETLGHVDATGDLIHRLRNIHRHVPDQCIDWDALVENATIHSNSNHLTFITENSFITLVICRVIKRARELLRIKTLHNEMDAVVMRSIPEGTQGRRDFVEMFHKELDGCEDKYNRFMEALTSIELVLWKNKMDDCCGQQKKTRRSKKMRMDDSNMRKQCRLRCGAETNIVIEHVLPYLDIL